MKVINLKEPKWAELRDALNRALYYAQNDAMENGATRVRASLKLNVNLATGMVEWAVASDNGSGDMQMWEAGWMRA